MKDYDLNEAIEIHDQAVEQDRLFDDVERTVQKLQPLQDNMQTLADIEVLMELLTLAKAIQTLRPSTDHDPNPKHETDASRPTSADPRLYGGIATPEGVVFSQAVSSGPSPDLEKQSEQPKLVGLDAISLAEQELLHYMRSEGMRPDSMLSLVSGDGCPGSFHRMLLQYLRE